MYAYVDSLPAEWDHFKDRTWTHKRPLIFTAKLGAHSNLEPVQSLSCQLFPEKPQDQIL